MKSNPLSSVEGPSESQGRLALPRPFQRVEPTLVAAQSSMLGAIKLCISLAGLESYKELYLDLDIDAGHWTRIMSGDGHSPINKLPELMRLCGNEVPFLWLLMERGYDPHCLRLAESEADKRVRVTQEEADRRVAEANERARIAEIEKRAIIDAFRGRAAA